MNKHLVDSRCIDRPSLSQIASMIPHGHECQQCGGATFNWIKRCARYVEDGEACCPTFRGWVESAMDENER